MAKANEVATKEDLYAGLSPEDVAEMMRLTGQAANVNYEKSPILKINLCGKPDKNKNRADIGNFVLNQSIKVIDGNRSVEDIGKDLGDSPEITVIKVAKQFSYYNDQKDLRCASQLITESNEVAVGYNLKHACSGGTCPRRATGIDKKERCTCQYVVYVEAGPDKDKALMYFKGINFMAFKEYLDSASPDPTIFYPTVLTTKEKTMGSVTYYEIYPQLDKNRPYDIATRKDNMDKLRAVSRDITSYKASQSTQNTKQVTYKGKTIEDAETDGFSDIEF